MKILIAGGTGFIGKQLIREWSGNEIRVLTRGNLPAQTSSPNLKYLTWDGIKIPETDFKADIVVNLAGAGIADQAWTPSRRKLLLESRVHSTRACVEYIRQQSPQTRVLINASAVGFYGAGTLAEVDETSPAGNDFLAEVSQVWEQEALRSPVRTVILRTGVVLGPEGGALAKLLPLFQTGLGGWLGSGTQAFPWIHVKDVTASIRWLADQTRISGPVNLVSPQMTNNKVFSKTLAKILHRPCIFPVPAFVLKLILGERSDIILKGQKVVPAILLKEKYPFIFPDLTSALKDITVTK